jgi:integrase
MLNLTRLHLGSAHESQFQGLGINPHTQHVRRLILDKLCQSTDSNGIRRGDKPYAQMEARNVRMLRDEKANTPEAANQIVKMLRQVFAYAVVVDWAKANPAKEVPYLKTGTKGFHTWTMDEVSRFEERHPIGTKARLALALMLYTGQRRSDIIQFGRQHVKNGWLKITQQKNRNRAPITIEIPVLPESSERHRCFAVWGPHVLGDRIRAALHIQRVR